MLKPSWKKVPGKPKKYNLLEWHTVASDKQKSVNDKIFCVWNGDSMCIPALPTAVAELNTNISNVEENIDEALQLLQETKAMVPKSKLKEGILEVEKQMKLSGDLIATFRMATGGANLSAKMSFVESGGLPIGIVQSVLRYITTGVSCINISEKSTKESSNITVVIVNVGMMKRQDLPIICIISIMWRLMA